MFYISVLQTSQQDFGCFKDTTDEDSKTVARDSSQSGISIYILQSNSLQSRQTPN